MLRILNYELNEMFVHQHSECYKMQASERLCQLFIIPSQAAKARCPGVAPLHDPALGQPHEPFFRLGQLDHFQAQVMGPGIRGGLRPGVAKGLMCYPL